MNIFPLISVIIPVYNVEKYLNRCIESVINQTYTNLEIIIVDDGSPDNCGAICDEYAQKDSRIKVIHKENGGLSDARNAGLKVFEGEYLVFVDSDDYLDLNAIEHMLNIAISNNADIVIADIYIVNEDKNDFSLDDTNEIINVYNSYDAVLNYVDKDWASWNKLYKTKIHKKIVFPYGKIHEDEAIMLELIHNSKIVVNTSKKLYYYRQRMGSITGSSYSFKKMDWFDCWSNNIEYISEFYPLALKKALNKHLNTIFYNLDNLLMCGYKATDEPILKLISSIKSYKGDIIINKYVKLTKKIRVLLILIFGIRFYKFIYIK